MYNQDEVQGDTGRDFNNNNDNLVQEGNVNFEGEQGQEQFQQYSNQISPHEKVQNSGSDNSFHLGNKIDDFSRNENFVKKEKEISQQLENIFQEKTGYSMSTFAGKSFAINKILLLTTFIEFIFQRFDVVTLFLCIVVIFIELEIFTHKHLYKWLLLLSCSLLLDALVLIDISPVRNKKIFNSKNLYI